MKRNSENEGNFFQTLLYNYGIECDPKEINSVFKVILMLYIKITIYNNPWIF